MKTALSRVILILAFAFALPCAAQLHPTFDQEVQSASPVSHLHFSDVQGLPVDSVTGAAWVRSPTGATTYQAASPIPGSFSSTFTCNMDVSYPSNSMGNFEWNQPFTVVVQLHNFQGGCINGGSQVVLPLVTKGSLEYLFNQPGQQGWGAFLYRNPGGQIEACFLMTGAISAGTAQGVQACNGWASSTDQGVNAGHDYTLVFHSDGSGTPGGISIWVNGFATGTSAQVASNNEYVLTYDSSRTTAFGPSFGGGVSMLTPSQPVVIGGDVNNKWSSGLATATSTSFDDVAIIPGAMTNEFAQGLFLLSNAWQDFASGPASPLNVVFDNDGCQDNDNMAAFQHLIRRAQLHQVSLLGVNNTEGLAGSHWLYRMMLNRAGLGHVLMSNSGISTVWGGSNANWPDEPNGLATTTEPACANGSATTAYDSNITSGLSAELTDVQMYTRVMQTHTNVDIIIGGAYAGLSDCLLDSTCAPLLQAHTLALDAQDGWLGGYPTPANFGNCLNEGTLECKRVIDTATFPIHFYGGPCPPMCSGPTGPLSLQGKGLTDPYSATIASVSPGYPTSGLLNRSSFDSWPVLGALYPGTFFTVPSGQTGQFSITGVSPTAILHFTAGSGVQQNEQSIDVSDPNSAFNSLYTPWFMNTSTNANALYVPHPQTAAAGTPTPTPHLVHSWASNEGTGSTYADPINGNTMTQQAGCCSWGNVAQAAVGVPVYTNAAGACAANDTHTNFTNTTPFTIYTNVSMSAVSQYNIFYSDRTTNSALGYVAFLDPTNHISFGFGVTGFLSTTATFSANIDYGVMITYDGSNSLSGIKIFVDGVQQTLGAPSGSMFAFASNLPLCLGQEPPTNSFFLSLSGSVYNTQVFDDDESANALAIYHGATRP